MPHTPGPWDWFSYSDGRVYLATPNNGRLIVMDFVRKGMNYAQPRFAVWKDGERANMGGIMVPADGLIDVAKHPDARLMAASPDLLKSLQEFVAALVAGAKFGLNDAEVAMLRRGEAAIAKATGEQHA